jgi:hypothetical protein
MQDFEGSLDCNSKYEKMSQSKLETLLKTLCEDLPIEFLNYKQKIRDLKFDENPPYSILRGLFIGLMVKMNYPYDYQYDWVVARSVELTNILKN